MDKLPILSSRQQNNYIYSEKQRYFLYVPEKLRSYLEEEKEASASDDYYARKYRFLKENHFFEKEEIQFNTTYTTEQVHQNLAGLRQLLIEVTDSCNLKCKYCGYGEFYSNYDQRETCNQTFANVKILIDYLAEL